MALTGKLKLVVDIEDTGSNDISSPATKLAHQIATTFTDGNGSDQAEVFFSDERTTDGTGETLDLYGGLTDDFGNTINLTKVKAVIVEVDDASATAAIVGAAAAPFADWLGGTTPVVKVPVGGFFVIAHPLTGWSITNASNDGLKITGTSGNVTYRIIIIGCTS